MKPSVRISSASLVASLAFGVSGIALAHHSFAMFDRSQEVAMEGTVVRWAFNSPHIALYLRDIDGDVWALEGAAPASLITRTPAMTGFTFKPGDHLRTVYCPLRDGRAGGAIGIIITDDDTWYRPNDGGCGPNEKWEEWLPAGYTSKAEAEAEE